MTEKANGKSSEATKVQISIQWKILIGFTVIFTLVYFLAMSMFSNIAISAADNQIQEDLTQALNGAASGIDVQTVLELAETGEPNADGFSDDPRFIELMDWLDSVHTAEPDAWPYIYVDSENEGEIYFVVDLYARYFPDDAAGFMEAYTSNSGFIVIGLNELTYRAVDRQFIQNIKNWADGIEDNSPGLANITNNFADWLVDNIGFFSKKDFGTYGDRFGRWASGYRPLEGGKGIAAIGVDFTAQAVNEVRQEIRDSVQRAFLIAYPILLAIVFWFANVFTRPIITLTSAAERVGEGDYDVEFEELISEKYRDEIDVLASVFGIMVQKVYKREQRLRQQVARLRIEIDQTKKQEEVEQIVDSDFFKHLQSRASNLRSQRKASMETSEEDTPEEGQENQAEE
jgi:HAMP domain-containing protein